MNETFDDDWDRRLADYDEALRSGNPSSWGSTLRSTANSSEFDDAQACVRLLARVWPRHRDGASNMRSPPAAQSPPRVLGDYEILAQLAQGGMGIVYKARHRQMDRLVALKVMNLRFAGNADALARFRREVRVAAQLQHPHIVAALDAREENGTLYLVMEYVAGEDLAAVVRKHGPLPVAKAVEYLRQATEGLAYAHDHGVVHRDIKPGNLLCDGEGRIKILDMGLARLEHIADEAATDCMTQTNLTIGTADFMSPEQARSSRQADQRSDIYSLGCTLYTLLTGKPIYGGESSLDKLVAHRTSPVPSLKTSRPDVPAALDALFQQMVAKNPAERPQSMRKVCERLHAIWLELEGAAMPLVDTHLGRRSRWGVRTRLVSAGMLALLVFAGAVLSFGAAGWFAADPATSPPHSHLATSVSPLPLTPPMDYALRFAGKDCTINIETLNFAGQHPLTMEARLRLLTSVDGADANIACFHHTFYLTTRTSHYEAGWWENREGTSFYNTALAERTIRANETVHLAAVYDGRALLLFIDGQLRTKISVAENIQRQGSGGGLRIADNTLASPRIIDEVRISAIARYDKNFTPQERFDPDEHTLALYHFDEGQGDMLVDSSGHNHHGKIPNPQWVRSDGTPIAPPENYALELEPVNTR